MNPDRFTIKTQGCACDPVGVEMLAMLSSYFEAVNVKLDVQVMEYAAHLSVMNNNTNAPGYFFIAGMSNPFTSTRVNFISHTYNPAQWDDPAFGQMFADASHERDDQNGRQAKEEHEAENILIGDDLGIALDHVVDLYQAERELYVPEHARRIQG